MRKNTFYLFTGIIISLLVCLFYQKVSRNTDSQKIFWDVGEEIHELTNILEKYHPAPSSVAREDAILEGFVESYGNVYTEYISPRELVSFQTMIQGDFEGIGAYIEENPNGVYISDVLPDSPAQKWGLLPGDMIQFVDGISMYGKKSEEAITYIRGPAGTPVVLDLFSTLLSSKRKVTLVRQKLELPIITEKLHDNILHIHLLSFNEHSKKLLLEILDTYSWKYGHILLDLRNNGGWLLQSAVDVWSIFIEKDKIIATVVGKNTFAHISHGQNISKYPLSILVNGQTASAAEILAAALKFHLKAPVYWTQTFWKGSVQELYPLNNGGQLKVTTAHWITAAGEKLDQIGLTPDVVVLPTIADISSWKDGQIEKVLELMRK